MLDIPARAKTLFNGLSPWSKDSRQLVIVYGTDQSILAGWNVEQEQWHAAHWEGWHKKADVLTHDHEEMVRWCERKAWEIAGGGRKNPS